MKFFFLKILFFFNVYCYGQDNMKENMRLTAVKNNFTYSYRPGTPVRVSILTEDNKPTKRGKLFKVTDKGIFLSSFKKKDTTLTFIPVESILGVKKLLRKQRLIIGLFSVATFGVILGILGKEETYFLTPTFVAGLYTTSVLIYGNLGIFLVETLSQKTIKKGWRFNIQ